MKKYEATISSIGELAAEFFDQNMMIIFNNDAPEELQEIAVNHTKYQLAAEVAPGDRVFFGDNEYTVTAVGHEANKTLASMGHATFRFDGAGEADLPGNIHVTAKDLPAIAVGAKIIIEA